MAHTVNTMPYWMRLYELSGSRPPADWRERCLWEHAPARWSDDPAVYDRWVNARPDSYVSWRVLYGRGEAVGWYARQFNRRDRHRAKHLIREGRWDEIDGRTRNRAKWMADC